MTCWPMRLYRPLSSTSRPSLDWNSIERMMWSSLMSGSRKPPKVGSSSRVSDRASGSRIIAAVVAPRSP